MTYLVPFNDKFAGEIRTIYSVNSDEPNKQGGSLTTSEKCPYCSESNLYRFYEPVIEIEEGDNLIQIYECKCASCRKEFNTEIKFEN